MADFTGDRYADLVLHMVSGEMFIGNAPNVTGGVSAGLAFGPIAQTGALGAAALAVGILIGVAIGTTFMLILSNDRLRGVLERLLKRTGVVQS
jgi:hypothetical protein